MQQMTEMIERHPSGLVGIRSIITRHRPLLWRMLQREVTGRYRGTALGLLWSFVTPLLMLSVYTFVFSVVFQTRWAARGGVEAAASAGTVEFALILFCGLVPHAFFSECLSRSPSMILNHANFVRKVVFPLEILPVVGVGSALFHLGVSLCVLLLAKLVLTGTIPPTAVLAPLVLLPFVLLTLGCAWFLASMGVFLRDIGQIIGLVTMALMFLSPIFYPVESLPEAWRPWLALNPLVAVIDGLRAVLLWGALPDWYVLGVYTGVACAMFLLGFAWFQKTRKGFADVV